MSLKRPQRLLWQICTLPTKFRNGFWSKGSRLFRIWHWILSLSYWMVSGWFQITSEETGLNATTWRTDLISKTKDDTTWELHIASRVMRQVAPSCWNHIPLTSTPSNSCQKKVRRHATVTIAIDIMGQTVTFWGCIAFCPSYPRILLVNEAVEVEVSFVTKDNFAMELAIVPRSSW